MDELLNSVRQEIENLHAFFVAWFRGDAKPEELDEKLVTRIPSTMLFVSPEGNRVAGDELIANFRAAHGSNPNFDIRIEDVVVRQASADYVLVTYIEHQYGAKASPPENTRFSTALLSRKSPAQWLHVHETYVACDP